MTLLKYNRILKKLKGLRAEMIEAGVDQENMDIKIFDLHVLMCDNDDTEIIEQVAKTFLKISEDAEQYEICVELQKVVEQIENDK